MKGQAIDRCPCGSGKPKSTCCQRASTEKEKVVPLAPSQTDPLSDQVWKKLQRYLERAVDPKEIQRAYSQWRPNVDGTDTTLTPEIFDAAFDWLFFGYRVSRGGSICANYTVFGDDLSPKEQKLLARWALSSPGFFLVEKANSRGEVQVRRLPDDHLFSVVHKGTRVKKGMLISAWLLPNEAHYRFGHAVGLIENDIDAPLRHVLGMELDLYGRQNPNADWDTLYRELWPRLQESVTIADVLRDRIQYCKLPKGPRVQWNGEPIFEEVYADVEALIMKWAPAGPPLMREHEHIIRLFWDGVLALRPKVIDPPTWTAALLYTYWHTLMGHPQITADLLAHNLKVSTPAVNKLSKQLVDRLKITRHDLRYINLLDGMFRQSWRNTLVDTCCPDPAEDLSPTAPVKP